MNHLREEQGVTIYLCRPVSLEERLIQYNQQTYRYYIEEWHLLLKLLDCDQEPSHRTHTMHNCKSSVDEHHQLASVNISPFTLFFTFPFESSIPISQGFAVDLSLSAVSVVRSCYSDVSVCQLYFLISRECSFANLLAFRCLFIALSFPR